MSTFYQSLPYKVQRSFKIRKKRFKKNKPCAICGRRYPSDEMMVAHIKPVSELTDWEALYDIKNWEVRCIYCERELNRKNGIIKSMNTQMRKEKLYGTAQVEQPRCSEEEIHGSVCEDGGEQEAEHCENEGGQP